MTVHGPYTDKRKPNKPYVVTVQLPNNAGTYVFRYTDPATALAARDDLKAGGIPLLRTMAARMYDGQVRTRA